VTVEQQYPQAVDYKHTADMQKQIEAMKWFCDHGVGIARLTYPGHRRPDSVSQGNVEVLIGGTPKNADILPGEWRQVGVRIDVEIIVPYHEIKGANRAEDQQQADD
jgi:hypothetical protein